ncbi:MAG: histidine kinase [Rhodobacteraceae bacterium]|nr:histidine kinase [Paracoccaceae bacterium]
MKGSVLMGGLLGFTAIFGATLWYFQNYAYYEVTHPEDFTMRLTLNNGSIDAIPAHDFTVLDAKTSPLKFRACFTVENSIPMMTETYVIYDDATPLKPPSWFDCFDYARLTRDLKSGEAVAFLAQKNIYQGVDRVVAVYGDGRAYAWHQLNQSYAE